MQTANRGIVRLRDVPLLHLLDSALMAMMFEHKVLALKPGGVTLKSGKTSGFYVGGRENITDHPLLLKLVGQKIARIVWQNMLLTDKQPILIGIPTAGTALAVAAANESVDPLFRRFMTRILRRELPDIGCRVMRETRKTYGSHQTWINGEPDLENHTYWMVDNTASDGDSKIEAGEKWKASGYPERPPLIILIERAQGADTRLITLGFDRLYVAFSVMEMLCFYDRLGLLQDGTFYSLMSELIA